MKILVAPKGGCAEAAVVQNCFNASWSCSKLQTRSHREKLNDREREHMEPISVVILIRTDTTFDHSQKAEKV